MKSDSQLRQEVEDELANNPAIDANRIGVGLADGIVTLSGQVPNYAQKVAAEKCTLAIAGVVAVVMHIEVALHDADRRTDEDIALSARAVLDWIAGLEESTVKVKVEQGWVTLSGEVRDGYRSHIAEKNIRHMRGVLGMTNNIRITGRASSTDIEYNIRKAIQRHTERELKHLGVEVDDGAVTLTGRVSSSAEKAVVWGAARSTPGVRTIVDRLSIGSE
ncbi:BON domain-containing protein [Paraburkholderia sp. UYCP14C]|uniref:BON domain-containing protein n=1 Tax=Paraburkholderia sp. UYCP14C TaxID=2511130 RepID=UPI0010211DBC|nr:BON domain-containing protein [Paraburkholderia sp. UYCP14C]RZF27509.1 BON domain-containing protein [Paraburkholderia sp. UYCP14C]